MQHSKLIFFMIPLVILLLVHDATSGHIASKNAANLDRQPRQDDDSPSLFDVSPTTTTTTTTTEDWRMELLAKLTSPKPTTITPRPLTLDPYMRRLYSRFGYTLTSTYKPILITGPWVDDEHPLTEPTTVSTTTTAAAKAGTKSYLDMVLDKWLKDGRESVHSYTDVYAGLPVRPKDIPNIQTDFRKH